MRWEDKSQILRDQKNVEQFQRLVLRMAANWGGRLLHIAKKDLSPSSDRIYTLTMNESCFSISNRVLFALHTREHASLFLRTQELQAQTSDASPAASIANKSQCTRDYWLPFMTS